MSDLLDVQLADLPHEDLLSMWSGARGAVPLDQLVEDVEDLDSADMSALAAHLETGGTIGSKPAEVKTLRHTHHRLAQLLAAGMDEGQAALLCNYSVSRVSTIKNTPAFANLVAYYKSQVDVAFTDWATAAAELSKDFLQHLQEQLDLTPEKFGPAQTLEAIKTLADRTGNAPVNRNVQLNVNVDMADRLRAAQARLKALPNG